MVDDQLKADCQNAFDAGFDSVEPTWRQLATVGEPATDFTGGVQAYGKMCHAPTLVMMRSAGRQAANLLNEEVAKCGALAVVTFLNGEERPRLEFSEENGRRVVRVYFDFGVKRGIVATAKMVHSSRYEAAEEGYWEAVK